MIKKLQHIAIGLLSMFYLVLSIGIEVDLHYCLGELKDIKLFNHEETTNNCCSDDICSLERAFQCCDNEHICYHIDDDQRSSNNLYKLYPNQNIAWASITSNVKLHQVNISSAFENLLIFERCLFPPPYLLNCSFIYYG